MKVLILRGIPGSGKTRLIKDLHNAALSIRTVSADDYFMRDGQYQFDARRLSDAHGDCFKRYLGHIEEIKNSTLRDHYVLVVDNTNITAMEISPYLLAAQAHQVPHAVYTVFCEPHVAYARGTHGVSLQQTWSMFLKMMNEPLPPWWKQIRQEKDLIEWLIPD